MHPSRSHRHRLPSLSTLSITLAIIWSWSVPAFAVDEDYEWATEFAGVGFDGEIYDATSFGTDLVVAGRFRTHSGASTPTVARWDGSSWHAMANPGWSFGRTVVEFQGELYAHGFWGAAFVPRHFIKWDGADWVSVAVFQPGYLGIAHEMVVYGDQLIITGDVGINGLFNVFAFNGTDFLSVGNAPDGSVLEMTVYDGELYATGFFATLLDSTVARGIARWDGAEWYPVHGRSTSGGPLAEGLRSGSESGSGYSLTVHDGKLVIGGAFDHAGDLPVTNLCAYDAATQTWIDLGPSPQTVTELTSWNGDLYAGGDLSTVGGVAVNRLARWDGSSWSPVGLGFDSAPNELYEHDGSLVIAGRFRSAGEVQVDRVARWDGLQWHDLAGGADDEVAALLSFGSDLVAIGEFTEIGGVAASHVARWDGTAWHPYGSGLPTPPTSCCEHGGELFVGGGAFPEPAYIQRWDGSAWQDIPLPETVHHIGALGSYAGELVVGASYFVFGSIQPHVGRYDGVGWQPLPSTAGYSVDNGVDVIVPMNGELLLGGSFFYVENRYPSGGWTEARAARWDGTYLHALEPIWLESTVSGQQLESTRDIADWDGKTFLGGGGSYAGGRLYSWDGVGTNWQLVGDDVNGTIYALEVYGGRLYAGGSFSQVGTYYLGGTASSAIGALRAQGTAALPVSALALEPNHPNPFNPSTTVQFEVPEGVGLVTLSVHDATGRLVRTLYSGIHRAGRGEITWNGADDRGVRVASGTYYCRLAAGGMEVSRKMVLMK